MRKIKFRAWDKENKIMMGSVGFSDSDCGRVWIREQYMVDDGSNGRSSNWIPMQYIGFHDKNSKEIYEGDIVTDGRRSYTVEFNNGWFRAEFAGGAYDLWEEATDNKSKFEIIGNIYENPELLKDEN